MSLPVIHRRRNQKAGGATATIFYYTLAKEFIVIKDCYQTND